jgi:ribosomal protein L7Ae-like RNA K-turn-binding protein
VTYRKFYSLIGFAYKAGKCRTGATAVKELIARGKVKLLLLDGCSKAAMGQFAAYDGERILLTEGKLGAAVGKEIKIAAITDKNFADSIRNEYNYAESAGGEGAYGQSE